MTRKKRTENNWKLRSYNIMLRILLLSWMLFFCIQAAAAVYLADLLSLILAVFLAVLFFGLFIVSFF